MESKTFTYETYYEQKLSFELSDHKLIYTMDDDKPVIADWNDITLLKPNRVANTLEINIANQEKPVTVPYGIENFVVFLEELCDRLGRKKQDIILSNDTPFGVTTLFGVMMALFIGPAIILLVAALINSEQITQMPVTQLILTMAVPAALIIYGVLIPIKAIVLKDRLLLNGLVRRSAYHFDNIDDIGYELVDLKKRGNLLVAYIQLKNGKKVQVKWLKDLPLFFTVLKLKYTAYQNKL